MATSVDDIKVKISVEGTAQVNDATKAMDGLNSAATRTGEATKAAGGNIRNVAFQVQDMAVQIAGGTSAFVALGQQIPQLLGGFGVMGAVIGAVAAVSIPLLQAGLKAAGVDMRNFDEINKDLTKSIKDLHEAQKSNMPSVYGLGASYGDAAGSAKAFFDIQEQFNKIKVNNDLSVALKKLKDDYASLGTAAEDYAKRSDVFMASQGASVGALEIGNMFKRSSLGLTVEQGKEVADRLKDIDKATPEQALKTIEGIAKYLGESKDQSKNLSNFLKETVQPILDLNKNLIDTKQIMNGLAQESSNVNAAVSNIQAQYSRQINAARRAGNERLAIEKEAQEKIAEFNLKTGLQSAKDGVDRAQEMAAFEYRINQEKSDKIAAYNQQQSRAVAQFALGQQQTLANYEEANRLIAQNIGAETRLVGLSADQVEIERTRDSIIRNQAQALRSLEAEVAKLELNKKLGIDPSADAKIKELRKTIQGVRDDTSRSADSAQGFVERLQAARQIEADRVNQIKLITEGIDRQAKSVQALGDATRTINQGMADINFEKSLKNMTPLEAQIARINENARKAAESVGAAFAAGFTEEDMTAERAKQLADGLERIAQGYKDIATAQTEMAYASSNFAGGWDAAFKEFRDNASDAGKRGRDSFAFFARTTEDAIVNLLSGVKTSFKGLINTIVAELARIAVRQGIAAAVGNLTAAGGGGLLGLLGLTGAKTAGSGFLDKLFGGGGGGFSPEVANATGASIFAMGFAAGGPVNAGKPIMVGERGPEMFLPTTAGSIIPNNQLGQSGANYTTNVNYNISAVDASSFRSLVASDPEFIFNITEKGRRGTPTRRLA